VDEVTAAGAERVVAELEASQVRLHQAGRAAMGVTGSSARAEPFWRTLRQHHVSVYAIVALGVLFIVDTFQSSAVVILAPEISRALGVGRGVLALMLTLSSLALVLATLPIAALVERRPLRARVAKLTAFGWSATTLFSGFVTSAFPMAAILVLDGASSGSTYSVHQPLLMDVYPTAVRARIMGIYTAFQYIGGAAAPLFVALLAGPFDFTWRGVLLVMGLTCLGASVLSIGLRDPGFGHSDTARLRGMVNEATGTTNSARVDRGEYELRFFEIARRLFMVRSFRRVLAGYTVIGMMQAPLQTFFAFYLAERWGLDPAGRGLFISAIAVTGIVASLAFSRFNDRLFRRDPAHLLRFAALLQMVSAVAIPLALVSPWFAGLIVLFGASVAATALQRSTLTTAFLSVVRPQMRPHASGLRGIFEYGVGGIAGVLLLTGTDSRYGLVASLAAVVAIFCTIATALLWSGSRLINADLDHTVTDLIEEEELQGMAARGVRLPMLACRHVDFSYGQLQVLFDVDFNVEEGELVALLGTNGAGKSTLLRVVSGLGLPSRGSVRFRGGDITFLEPPRRVRLGITQVPGGRAVFGAMSVVDNLRTYGYTLRRDRATVERGIATTFDCFPRLHERRNQAASTLSGGEQQMLGLAKALILQPRLLLIDELSLGLAPKIVAELLVMVRRINEAGTAVVLVEQSVNVALSVARHAYFMEKGQIRFDGPSQQLLERPDLLRSVFLEGAAQGLGGNGGNGGSSGTGRAPAPAGAPA
jgi:ABC-type branched-subunit amino acid transport system ATPase component/sugar phosphate permease